MLFELQDIRFRYTSAVSASVRQVLRPWALDKVSLQARAGEKLALLGANGSGKSTLLWHLNGLLRPEEGGVRFQGKPLVYSKQELRELRQQVALVFQDPDHQLFAGTLYEDVSFGPVNLGLDASTVHARVTDALKAVGLSQEKELPLHMLSFGQKKRAALAGALAMRPQVLVLDEPTAGLDPRAEANLLSLLDGWVKEGLTVIFSTHDVDLAYAWASRITLLQEGRVLAEGSPAILGEASLMQEAHLRLPYALQGAHAHYFNNGVYHESPNP